MDLLEALDAVRAELAAVGIRGEVDARDVNPPGAWITIYEITHGVVVCGGDVVRVYVYLVVPDTGTTQAITQLSEMLTSAKTVFDLEDSTYIQSLALPGGNSVPSMRLTVDVHTD
jgi:hypothetical protein